MFGNNVTLFRLSGFAVKLDLSWLFLALLIVWSLSSGYFPVIAQGLSIWAYVIMGIVGALGLFASLVIHEFAHSVVARSYGMTIRGITLFLFGGVAEMEDEPPTAKAEFWMAIAGPLTSLGLALLFFGATYLAAWSGPTVAILDYLAFINLLLAGFNMLPAFPLDGGRVLRSALWGWRGDLRWATRIASRIGIGAGIALIILGAYLLFNGMIIGGLWWILIGFFLQSAASSSYARLEVERALGHDPVARFMTANPDHASPALSIEDFVERHVYRSHHEIYPLVEAGLPAGLVRVARLREVPREQWAHTTISTLAEPLDANNSIEANRHAADALKKMQSLSRGRLVVLHQGRLAGMITLKDMLRVLELRLG